MTDTSDDTTSTDSGSPPGPDESDVREQVRTRYAAAALAVTVTAPAASECCAAPIGGLDEKGLGATQYADADRDILSSGALAASLGCGDTVLDLGSGGGIDVLLSARRVASPERPTAWT